MKRLVALMLLASTNVWSAPVLSSAQETRIKALIKETLISHPEILVEAAETYNKKAEGEKEAAVKKTIAENQAFLYQDPASPRLGSAQPKLTLVVFTDYNCSYCKQFEPSVMQIVKEFPQVAVVFKYLPFRTESSATAARDALTVWQQQPEKFPAFDQWLMAKRGNHDDTSIEEAKRKAGITLSAPNKQSLETLDKSLLLAEQLGIHGTPATLIGEHLLPGYVSYESLKAMVTEQLAKS